jgi:hypothetical protein
MPSINQRRLAASLVAAALAAPIPAFAAATARVDSAAADMERKILTLRGSFASPGLKVYLGGHTDPLAIRALTGTTLEALLPTGLAPGNYHIVVGDDEAFAITLGPVGPAGDAGAAGVAGIRGAAGPRGNDGQRPAVTPLPGAAGAAGADGAAGAAGPAGAKGAMGDTGPAGSIGPRGTTGDPGSVGAAGPQGPQGDAGANGAQGLKGARGDAGPQGARGPTGAAPVQGPGFWQGPQGPQGRPGDPGTYAQLARWISTSGVVAVPMGSEATLAYGQVGTNPSQSLFNPRGDLILNVDAMAIMTADWSGCELKLKLVVEHVYGFGQHSTSLPFSRYLPRDIARHVGYTFAVPDVDRLAYSLRLVGTSACPGTALSEITIGGQWLNRLP